MLKLSRRGICSELRIGICKRNIFFGRVRWTGGTTLEGSRAGTEQIELQHLKIHEGEESERTCGGLYPFNYLIVYLFLQSLPRFAKAALVSILILPAPLRRLNPRNVIAAAVRERKGALPRGETVAVVGVIRRRVVVVFAIGK